MRLDSECWVRWPTGFSSSERSRKSSTSARKCSPNCSLAKWQPASLLDRFYEYCRAIGQNLGDALHHFSGVVARANHGVAAQFRGVDQHEIESFRAGFLAQICQQSDVATDQRLQPGADGAENGAGAHYDSAHNAEGARYPETIQLKLRGDHSVSHHPSTACVGCHRFLFLSKPRLSSRRTGNYIVLRKGDP